MTFDKNLENRIVETLNAENIRKEIGKTINLKNYETATKQDDNGNYLVVDAAGDPILTTEEHRYHRVKNAALQKHTVLATEIDQAYGGYENALKPTLQELSERGRFAYYEQMITKGVLPKDPSKELITIKSMFGLAKMLEDAKEKGDSTEIENILRKVLDIAEPGLLDIDRVDIAYLRGHNPSGLLKAGGNVAKRQREIAYSLLKKMPNVQAEVEKTITGMKEVYALAATEIYKVYASDEEKKYRETPKAKRGNLRLVS